MAARSGMAAVLQLKCPRCRQGNLFTHDAYDLRNFDKMPEKCPVCGSQYEPEVGFYWGAMYISYGFSVAILLVAGLSLNNLANDPPTWVYLVTVTLVIVFSTTILFRYARAVMLHLFGGTGFDPQYKS